MCMWLCQHLCWHSHRYVFAGAARQCCQELGSNWLLECLGVWVCGALHCFLSLSGVLWYLKKIAIFGDHICPSVILYQQLNRLLDFRVIQCSSYLQKMSNKHEFFSNCPSESYFYLRAYLDFFLHLPHLSVCWAKFSADDLHLVLLSSCEFCENWCNTGCTSFRGVNGILTLV